MPKKENNELHQAFNAIITHCNQIIQRLIKIEFKVKSIDSRLKILENKK